MIQVFEGDGVMPFSPIPLGHRVGWQQRHTSKPHDMGICIAYARWINAADQFGMRAPNRFRCAAGESSLVLIEGIDKTYLMTHSDAVDLGMSVDDARLAKLMADELLNRDLMVPGHV